MSRSKTLSEKANTISKSVVFNRVCKKELSASQISEIEKIFSLITPKERESVSTIERIAKIVNETNNIYDTFIALNNTKARSIDWYITLYGFDKGTQQYNSILEKSRKPREYSDDDLITSFFKLKCIQENVKGLVISDSIKKVLLEFNKKYKVKLISDEDKQKVVDILKFHNGDNIIKRYEILKSNPPYTEEYRNARYSEEENKIRKLKRTENAKRNFPNCAEYIGYENLSKDEIITLTNKTQKERSLQVKKKVSPTQISYWLRKGYTEEEAYLAVKERQTTFTLEKCIETLGVEAGTARWQERQDKWQATLNNKTPEELDAINKSKGKTKEQLILKFGIEKTNKIINARCNNREFGVSKEAENFFKEVDLLSPSLLQDSKTFYKNSEEFVVYDNENENIYFIDYAYKNKIIEYDGSYWHGDPRLFENDTEIHPSRKCSISEIHYKDNIRYNNLINLGYDVLRLWSFDVINDKENSLLLVKKFLGLE